MANILLRDVDEDVLKHLKELAKTNGRSLQAEIQQILQDATVINMARTRRMSDKWLKRLANTTQSDSTDLIREDRER